MTDAKARNPALRWIFPIGRWIRGGWLFAGLLLLCLLGVDALFAAILPNRPARLQIDADADRTGKQTADIYAGATWYRT